MIDTLNDEEKSAMKRAPLSVAQDLVLKQMGLLHGARAILRSSIEGSFDSASAVASTWEVISVLEVYASNLQRCIQADEFNHDFALENFEPEKI